MSIKNPKFFIGPMSKNIVDSIIKFCNETNNIIGIIPSRRQIENTGGYVNNWTTPDFCRYVRERTENVLLVRDHSGPGQGQEEDDGYGSLLVDCNCFDVIHIDPWKKYNSLEEGAKETLKMIKYCHDINPAVEFEIATEEAIRRFETFELRYLLNFLRDNLDHSIYKKITYLVIQSGTSLKGTQQTGKYDRDRLEDMLEISSEFNMISKEHNGDYIGVNIIRDKFLNGLNSINIAPEFGLIETMTYLSELEEKWSFREIDDFWDICFRSGKWKKWVNDDFNPLEKKRDLIKICGHYVLSDPEFLERIKSKLPGIDEKVIKNINKKLKDLHG
jgi:hypothetical protein